MAAVVVSSTGMGDGLRKGRGLCIVVAQMWWKEVMIPPDASVSLSQFLLFGCRHKHHYKGHSQRIKHCEHGYTPESIAGSLGSMVSRLLNCASLAERQFSV